MTTRTLEEAYNAVSRGYALVVQNERGRFFSEGEWDILGTPITDGYDAFEWMSKQPGAMVNWFDRLFINSRMADGGCFAESSCPGSDGSPGLWSELGAWENYGTG